MAGDHLDAAGGLLPDLRKEDAVSVRTWRTSPAVLDWRLAAAVDPLGIASGLLIWGLAVWWLVPSFLLTKTSVIARIILTAHVPGHLVRAILVTLTLLGLVGLFGCHRHWSQTFAVCALLWWLFVWILLVISEPASTSTGSYGIVVALSFMHLASIRRSKIGCVGR